VNRVDIKQEEITTLHDLKVDAHQLIKNLSEYTAERPVCVVIPMLYKEIKQPALENIVKQLNKCTYFSQVIISLAARNEKEFHQVKRFFSCLSLPKLIIWCNSPKVEDLLLQLKFQWLDLLRYAGKGRDVWLALGIASLDSYAIAMHDADIQNYTEMIPTKLLYPLLEPELDFKFNKGYYARTSIDKSVMYGRVFRLFLHPLLRSLVDLMEQEPHFVRFLRAFRYPLSGECAMTVDLARDLDIPGGWGMEIGIMAEIYRNVAIKRICQTDLGFYEHKHQKIGDADSGLIKMADDIFRSLLRVLVEEDHIQVSRSFLLSLRVLYQKHAQDCIRKYHADALFNGISYDRHLEETMVEHFSRELMIAGNDYMLKPVGARLPDWLRAMSARIHIQEELLEIVQDQNKT
jgi:glucosyl-3-phosphoglycerate synthase